MLGAESIAVTFVDGDGEERDAMFTVAMLAVPAEDDVVEYGGKTYRAGPGRWIFSKGGHFAGVEVPLELQEG